MGRKADACCSSPRSQVSLRNDDAGEVSVRGAEREGEAQLRGQGHSQVQLGNEAKLKRPRTLIRPSNTYLSLAHASRAAARSLRGSLQDNEIKS